MLMFVFFADNSNRLSLVMEYFPLGSLEKYLREKKDRVSHKTLYLFGQQICQVNLISSIQKIHSSEGISKNCPHKEESVGTVWKVQRVGNFTNARTK